MRRPDARTRSRRPSPTADGPPGDASSRIRSRRAPRVKADTAPAVTGPSQPERLQKVLAETGLGSRREVERWITQGRIRVDGEVAVLGTRVTPQQRIQFDDRLITLRRKVGTSRVILLNKSAGTISARTDPEGRPTVFEGLPVINRGRWVVVGRLDAMTTGLLLFTDDGELANRLMHPSSMLDREYAVRVDGLLTDEESARLRDGVVIEGERMRFTDLQHFDGRGRNHWYHAVLMEGKQHEVKLLFSAVDHVVSRLKRVRFGPVVLPSRLKEGQWEELSAMDVNQLRLLVGLEPGSTPAGDRPAGVRQRGSVLLPYPALEARQAQRGD